MIARRGALGLLAAAAGVAALGIAPASAAPNGFEAFVQANVQKGLAILNNKNLSADQKRTQFQNFILTLTDMKRIARFVLGSYRRTATPQEIDAFTGAFQSYAVAVYQFYFAKYSGQTLKVTGSVPKSDDDVVVTTQLIDPNDHSGNQPLEVDFRVLREGGNYVVVDFSVGGIFLMITQQATFNSYLGQNNGSIPALVKHLADLAKTYH
jgi:phospholipid transport system substrate-binding protein